jgi:hypothetical protein
VKPQATNTPSLGPFGPDRQEDRVEEQRRQLDVVEVAALERLEALPQLAEMRWAVDFDSFPSPACSHSDSMSRIDSPLTKAPITSALSGSVRNTFVLHGNNFETNGSAASLTCGTSTWSSPSSVCTRRGRKPLRNPES